METGEIFVNLDPSLKMYIHQVNSCLTHISMSNGNWYRT